MGFFGPSSDAVKQFLNAPIAVKRGTVKTSKLLTDLLPAYLAAEEQKEITLKIHSNDDMPSGYHASRTVDLNQRHDEAVRLKEVLGALGSVRSIKDLPEEESRDGEITQDTVANQYRVLGRIAKFFEEDGQMERAQLLREIQRSYDSMLVALKAPSMAEPGEETAAAAGVPPAWEAAPAKLVKREQKAENPLVAAFLGTEVKLESGQAMTAQELLGSYIPAYLAAQAKDVPNAMAADGEELPAGEKALRKSALEDCTTDAKRLKEVLSVLKHATSVDALPTQAIHEADVTRSAVTSQEYTLARLERFFREEPGMASVADTVAGLKAAYTGMLEQITGRNVELAQPVAAVAGARR